MLRILFKCILSILSSPINKILKLSKFFLIYKSGTAIGDQLLITGVSRLIKEKYNYKIILFLSYSNFFLNNKNIYRIFKIDNKKIIHKAIIFILKNLSGERIKEFLPQKTNKNGKHFLINYSNQFHIAQTHCNHFNLELNFNKFKNEIFFSDFELKKFENELNLPKKFSVIQSTTKKSFTKNKEWNVQGMQAIVNTINNLNWIQVGTSKDVILNNCQQFFNLDFRKLSYLFYKAEFIVCYEGFFNHLASCFEKKNFLIHTGFLPTNFSFYPNNILIENNSKIRCYPCYDLECNNHNKLVNKYLKKEFVIKKIINNIV